MGSSVSQPSADEAKHGVDDDAPVGLVTQVSRNGNPTVVQTGDEEEDSGWGRLCRCLFRGGRGGGKPADSVGVNPQYRSNYYEPPPPGPTGHMNRIPALLEPLPPGSHKKTLVLDLDETLVHSSFKPVPDADFIVPVQIENRVHQVYVLKRPGADEFLLACAKQWDVVLFTASLAKYADPLLDILDKDRVISTRLFRESCVMHAGTYVKDLRRLGRPLETICIVDNSPQSYAFQPRNAIPIDSWFDDRNDIQLFDLIPYITDILPAAPDMTRVLDAARGMPWIWNQIPENVLAENRKFFQLEEIPPEEEEYLQHAAA
jgi:RNA polymerase II subunit A small phosphatase-like protein